ncbi:MAG: hypothetical protein ACTSX6_13835 [Candidatus Heimdallarchaeaceae archaeon]
MKINKSLLSSRTIVSSAQNRKNIDDVQSFLKCSASQTVKKVRKRGSTLE